jgi:SAM-dependent methyltransferase
VTTYELARAVWRQSPHWLQRTVHQTPALRRLRDGIKPHDGRYDADFYDTIDQHAVRSSAVMADSIVERFHPATVLDVGCGSGALLSALQAHGIAGTGLEYSTAALAYCRARGLTVHRYDLTTATLPPLGSYDLAVSFEVAEHLPARCAEAFVTLLTAHTNHVAFSAATPGQGGRDHVNEQPHAYWIDHFTARGFVYDEAHSIDCRARWHAAEADGQMAWWYAKNLLLFHRA